MVLYVRRRNRTSRPAEQRRNLADKLRSLWDKATSDAKALDARKNRGIVAPMERNNCETTSTRFASISHPRTLVDLAVCHLQPAYGPHGSLRL